MRYAGFVPMARNPAGLPHEVTIHGLFMPQRLVIATPFRFFMYNFWIKKPLHQAITQFLPFVFAWPSDQHGSN